MRTAVSSTWINSSGPPRSPRDPRPWQRLPPASGSAEYHGRRAGALGDVGCFSFYPSKNLGACGEGGIVVTNNPEWADAVRRLRDWGRDDSGVYRHHGYSCSMEEVQAAALRVKLRHVQDWIELRRERAALYDELLAAAGVAIPNEQPGCRHVYYLYVIRARERNQLRDALASRGVEARVHYPYQLDSTGSLPHSCQAAGQVLSLPMYPELPLEAVRRVADAVAEFASSTDMMWR